MDMASKAEPIGAGRGGVSLRTRLIRGLESCATEADIVQTLYAELHPNFGYDVILLQVLEREGWYHDVPIDHGVLQDLRRRTLADSHFGRHFDQPQTSVSYATQETVYQRARGPGLKKGPQTLIWVPIRHRGQPVGAVSYQLFVRRRVPPEELALLERVHAHLGVIVSNAYLNEMTRNQALSLTALNSIARALSSTHDEDGVVAALRATLIQLIPLDRFALVVPDEKQ